MHGNSDKDKVCVYICEEQLAEPFGQNQLQFYAADYQEPLVIYRRLFLLINFGAFVKKCDGRLLDDLVINPLGRKHYCNIKQFPRSTDMSWSIFIYNLSLISPWVGRHKTVFDVHYVIEAQSRDAKILTLDLT